MLHAHHHGFSVVKRGAQQQCAVAMEVLSGKGLIANMTRETWFLFELRATVLLVSMYQNGVFVSSREEKDMIYMLCMAHGNTQPHALLRKNTHRLFGTCPKATNCFG